MLILARAARKKLEKNLLKTLTSTPVTKCIPNQMNILALDTIPMKNHCKPLRKTYVTFVGIITIIANRMKSGLNAKDRKEKHAGDGLTFCA